MGTGLLEVVEGLALPEPILASSGIRSSEEAWDWSEEAWRLEKGVQTPKSEKLLKSWLDIGLGNVPKGGAGSFASYDAIIAAATAGQVYGWDFFKIAPSASQGVAGLFQTLWTAAGSSGAGSAPAGTPGLAYGDTAGGMTFPAPGGGQNKFAVSAGVMATQTGVLVIHDRLSGVGAVSTATTGAKTVASTALTRYSGTAAGQNEVWIEETTASTTTAAILRIDSYTDSAGTSALDAVATLTTPAAATVATWSSKLPLKAGNIGVRAVQSVNIGTASTAGVINVVIKRPLIYMPVISGQWSERDLIMQLMGLPQIFDAATLDMVFLAPSGVTTTLNGNIRMVYG